MGMILFSVSEVVFFFALFWAFFTSSLLAPFLSTFFSFFPLGGRPDGSVVNLETF